MRRSSRRRRWLGPRWDDASPGVQFTTLVLAMVIGFTVAVVIVVLFPPH